MSGKGPELGLKVAGWKRLPVGQVGGEESPVEQDDQSGQKANRQGVEAVPEFQETPPSRYNLLLILP